MADNRNITPNLPKSGMKLSKPQWALEGNEYSLAVNAEIQSVDGNFLVVTNTPSNLKCVDFPEGYKVIGVLPINVQNRTIFFLVHPTLHKSEIGYINNVSYSDTNDPEVNCDTCNNTVKEKDLDTTIPICKYVKIVNADCLNFDIDNPISATYEIGIDMVTGLPDKDNTTILFADLRNPRRFLNINNIPTTLEGFAGDCEIPYYSQELDCDAIRIVPHYKEPCIEFIDAPLGGSNKAGVYQFAVAYSTVKGENLTDYSIISNPISLFSKNRIVTVETDYNTNKSIKININNVDIQFRYINIVVLKTINSNTEAFLAATLPITSDIISYTYTGDNFQKEPRVTLETLQEKRAIYEYSKRVTSANRSLFWYILKDQRDINLQPVVSTLIHPKWQTEEALEGFYANPISSNYVSLERDEVYPYGIEFELSNGFKTATFPFVGRDKQYYTDNYTLGDVLKDSSITDPLNLDLSITGTNVLSSGGCEPEELNKLWQVYNTAINLGYACGYEPNAGKNVTNYIVKQCFSDTWVDGETIADKCCVELCDDANDNYCCCEQITITPSGTVTVYEYTCGNPFDLPEDPCDTTPLTNTSCSTAIELTPMTDNTCFIESTICGDDLVQNLPYIYSAPGGNDSWFTFSPVSIVQAIKIVMPTPFLISVYSDCPGVTAVRNLDTTEIFNIPATNQYCLVLDNLTEGDTYWIKIQSAVNPTANNWGSICINVPSKTGFYSLVDVPAVYQWQCTYYDPTPINITVSTDPTCLIRPYQYGEFAYWESTEKYPNNPEVWGDLCGQPIRHFKTPDCCVSHIHNSPDTSYYGINNRIYPLGITVDIDEIKNALMTAANTGLISHEERLQIKGYSIKRGNRRNNRSIIAKGLLYDMWRTPVLDSSGEYPNGIQTLSYFSNFPYNDLSANIFLKETKSLTNIKHPYYSYSNINNRYTFHSPNTSFDKPLLGTEIKLETVEYGNFIQTTSEVEKHAKYVILNRTAYSVAKALASAQIIHEASVAASSAGEGVGVLGTTAGSIVTYIIEFAINIGLGFASNYGKYTSNWLDIFKSLGNPENPSVYMTSVGQYNNYCCVGNTLDSEVRKRKILSNAVYLNSGNYDFTENGQPVKINNFERESSVYLSVSKLGKFDVVDFFQSPASICGISDDSRKKEPLINGNKTGIVSSYYASIKNYVPDQYGRIDQIEWLDTGFCGTIEWTPSGINPTPSGITPSGTCSTIFGGDTYINRFALKRKFPFFIQDAVGLVEDAPIMYKKLGNVGFPIYYFNSLQDNSDKGKFTAPFFYPPDTNFDNDHSKPFYQLGNVYLYNYGIPYFICESDYNVDLRHAEDFGNYKDFYPHVGDIVQWTQQYKNPISFDNTYYYNTDYSKQNRENFYRTLPIYYTQEMSKKRADFPNRGIYSGEGVQNWKKYLAADYIDLPLEDGKLISIDELEQQKVLIRQENSSKVFNAYITQESSLETIQITVGDMFKTKPREYVKTDLGYGGSTNYPLISSPFGFFWVDTENPSVLKIQADSFEDITRDKETKNKIQWFTENLPFNISKDFPEVDTDNNFKWFGIALTWNNKFDTLILTKKDYKLKPEFKGKITYNTDTKQFIYNGGIVYPTDKQYFQDKSFTIGYSALVKEWSTHYLFKPNYYTQTENFYGSGINYPESSGYWLHNLTNKSYQTFYGIEYPFILEYAVKSNLKSNILDSVNVNVTFDRFEANQNFYTKIDKFYNSGIIYNNRAVSGNMIFEVQQPNNSFQMLNNGNILSNGYTTLVKNTENLWNFNYFLDKSANNGQPYLTYQNNLYKELNNNAIDYNPKFMEERIRGDWFAIRLQNDNTRYRLQHRFTVNETSDSQ